MNIRSIIFWSHLVVGLGAGIFILIMSATGVLLTYERQILEWSERNHSVELAPDQSLVSVEKILEEFQARHPDEHHFDIRYVNRPGAAIPVWAGLNAYLIHPYSGEIIRQGPGVAYEFFDFVTNLHRWLAAEGEGFAIARAITNYSNLMFLFLALTGVYLWLPKIWKWPRLKAKIFFKPNNRNSRARDFNWHHVFSFWSLVPLVFIILSATIFYFPLANTVLYGAFGEEVPDYAEDEVELESIQYGAIEYDDLLAMAKNHAADNGAADWHSIWMQIGTGPEEVEFYIDRSLGRRPQYAYRLTMDINTGAVIEAKHHSDWTRGDQAWDLARFGHTGEWWGFFGQTIAGLASLAACLLVYTGLALAWRRLITPLFGSKRKVRIDTPV